MKKQKSSIIVLTLPESSGDESEKAMPKIDKEELRKYLQNSDEEDESDKKTSPKESKKLVKKRKTSSSNTILQDKPTKPTKKQIKPIQKDSPQKCLLQGDDFKRLQKKAKKLGASSLDHSQRKNNKYMVEYDNKKIHFGSANSEDYLTHKDPDRRDKYLTKAKKITNKDGELTYQLPSYPNYWSVKLLN